ncbi:MAG: integrase family protein [Pseudomonadota bacterium]|nr:integrase family protein [Pseudomonadota bacterium]
MAKVKLTAGRIRDFNCPADKAQAFLWDADVYGLAVRATPTGKFTFIFQAKLAGKDIRVTLGDTRTLGIDDARDEARRLGVLIGQGTDPRQDKQDRIEAGEAKRQESRRHDVTVGEAWAVYIEDRSPRWGEHTRRDHRSAAQLGGEPITRGGRWGRTHTIPGSLAPLLPLKLAELSPEHVKAWLTKENTTRPTRTALAFRLLRAFINWCEEHPDYRGIVDTEACSQKRVRQEVAKGNSKASDTLQREQLTAWFKAVRAIGNPVTAAYLQTVILTGARRDEILSLKWSDVDFQWNSLSIADKVEGVRIIPLTPYVASLLATLPRRMSKDGKPLPWVFSSPTAAGGRIQDPRLQLDKACMVAGIPKVTVHGLRRTFKNMSEWAESPAGITAQLMGHKPSAIAERHYTSSSLDLLRKWHVKIEAWMLEQAGIEQPEESAGGLRLVKTA